MASVRSWDVSNRSDLSCLEVLVPFVEVPWPVLLEQTREPAVGEEPPARLARRTVVALVVGICDATHRRATDRAGLAEPAVYRHLGPEGGDLGRELIAGLVAQPGDPFRQCRL